jgi:hypothetical protein
MTTIRVEAEVRDRLAALAATHGRSLGAELRAMLDEMMCRVSRLVTENWQPARRRWRPTTPRSPDGHRPGLATSPLPAVGEYPEYNS